MPVIDVATPAELVAAISNAKAGDEIVLADGTYPLTGVSCAAAGTQAAPIVVRAANKHGALIELDSLEGFKVTAPNWHFEGLDVRGVCAVDSNCEHAFHVMGAAEGFVLRNSRVRDFNAQLKVNASNINGTYVIPHKGLIEYNELGDTRGRNTSNPVTKLNIDTGDDWIVRGNFIHDAYKMGGDGVSYATFLKSGGNRGVVERNLVVCSKDTTGGTRIGLSLGGGGTGAQFCAPAFDPNVPCSIEHTGGTIRNNIIANCSDVGIYLNRAKDSRILYNTLIATNGIDFRFDTTSGEAVGNVLASKIRSRDSATMTATNNLQDVVDFAAWYQAPLVGDLKVIGDVSALKAGGPKRVDDDYCGRVRPADPITLGALEHPLGDCGTTTPPMPPDGGVDEDPMENPTENPTADGGCCSSTPKPSSILLALGLFALLLRRRR